MVKRMNSPDRDPQTVSDATTNPSDRRTPLVIALQAIVGGSVSFLVSVVLLWIYRDLWHVELPWPRIIFSSLAFGIYCGALSTWLGKRFWPILGKFLESF